jgi:xylulokinase
VSAREIVVTLDCGGSGAKAHAFDAAGGGHLASTASAYPAPSGDPGLFDPEEWWAAAALSLRLLVEDLGEPAGSFAGVTVSAVRIPTVLLDRQGEPTGPSTLNTDRRGERALDEVVAAIGAEELYTLTGHWPAPELGLGKLLWTRSQLPELWRRTATVLQLHDWFAYRLCGVVASEPSSAAMSQLLAVEGTRWAAEVLGAARVKASLLPEIVPAGTRLGGLAGDIASATGLPAGLPVHAGGGDTHISALSAAGASRCPVVVAGTTTPAQVAVAELPPSSQRFPLFTSAHVLAGHYALESNAGVTAGVLARLQGLDELSGGQLASALVGRGFELKPALGQLDVLSGNPFFSPEQWSGWPPPTVVGLRPSHSGADVRQAGLLGVAYALRGVVETLDRCCGTSSLPLVLTGGMSTNHGWDQVVAEVCRREVLVRPLEAVAGLAGAVLISGRAPGDVATSVPERRFFPSGASDFEEGYRTYLDRYRAASARQFATGIKGGPATGPGPTPKGATPREARPRGPTPQGIGRAGVQRPVSEAAGARSGK